MENYRLPISIKGVLLDALDRVCLLKNERNEWELPGGYLEPGESPEQALMREAEEELGIRVLISHLLDAGVYQVLPEKEIFIVAYRCFWDGEGKVTHGEEHIDIGWFSLEQAQNIHVPYPYLRAIRKSLGK
ncbi:NUDIX domain-containing protein [Melghirimyces algeriensis]|uniref:Mutator mutT protein n=1 Tax=Melghirimyces algeriensis TaxID=910412 RepID=A0A521ELK6_9BACL|nr:NUDIX hydrolase [Melghirimyces algeriensis]SMO84782.1 mutator mutT protein [Melghirimyces algeriensis]